MSAPAKHALPLLEALEAWSEPGLLVEPLCRSGAWRCWARRGSHDGPWVELSAKAWELPPTYSPSAFQQPGELRIVDPDFMQRCERNEAHVSMRHPATGREVFVTEKRLVVAEKWFEPHFAPASRPAPVSATPTTEAQFKRWLAGLDHVPTLGECRAAFPNVARDDMRVLKRKYARSPRGRPRKKVGD